MGKISPDKYYDKSNLDEQRKIHKEMCKGKLADLQLNNFLWNIGIIQSLNYSGILGFKELFKGKPAVIVGAGPSLDKNGEMLKELKDKAIIVACDAALPILVEKYDIYPHFVVMVDPTPKQKANFDDVDTTNFYTIAPSIVHPSIFRVVDPKHLAVYNLKDTDNELFEQIPYHTGRLGALPAAVLSTGGCFTFACAMWCDPVIFVGQDLSWPNTDKVYADGVKPFKVDYQKANKFKGHCMLFPNLDGELVLTHQTLMIFWAWLRDNSQYIKTKLVNATEGGILNFKSMKVMSLKKAKDKYCKKELVGVDEKIEKAYNYRHKDGLVEETLLPKFKKEHKHIRDKIVGKEVS